ncbi:MAG: nodulation protein NfeD [Chloroflexota bacterium]
MHRRFIRSLFAIPMIIGVLSLAAPTAASGHRVVVLPATGIVDNVLAAYLAESIAAAERDGAAAVVVRLNTPGGNLDATQRIVSSFLNAKVPIIVWVAPAGGRAASAGTFITLAANLAFMAPGTNIGAASPVGGQGEDIGGTLGEKVRNDAIANITAIAEARGRPVDWAVATVAEARSSPASVAVSVGAVDGIADTIEDVLGQATGRTLTIAGAVRTLDLADSSPDELAMNPFQAFLHLLSDPNIAFLLFTVGFYGLFFELQNPNFVTGILGGMAIILAFIGFGSLPLNVAGLLLIALAVVLFVLEPTVTSHGLLTVAGLVTFVLGASALFTAPGDPTGPLVEVAGPLIAAMAVTTAAFMGLIAWSAVRSRTLATTSGLVGATGGGLAIGSTGIVRSPLDPSGSIYAAGEEWSARLVDGGVLQRGDAVRVVGLDGLTAIVEPDASSSIPS